MQKELDSSQTRFEHQRGAPDGLKTCETEVCEDTIVMHRQRRRCPQLKRTYLGLGERSICRIGHSGMTHLAEARKRLKSEKSPVIHRVRDGVAKVKQE